METYGTTIIGRRRTSSRTLKVGRIALVYQTPDGEETGMWNVDAAEYQAVDNSYEGSVRRGIRMARQQASIDM